MDRLETVLPELAARRVASSAVQQRRCSTAAAEWAIRLVGVDNDFVRSALVLLSNGADSDVNLGDLARLVEELDEQAWSVQDAVEEGGAAPEDYLAAFGRARAVAAVYFAAHADPKSAALGAVYEASAVIPNPISLFVAIESVLT